MALYLECYTGVIGLPELDEKEFAYKASNKKQQKLYDHYVETFKQKPVFLLET